MHRAGLLALHRPLALVFAPLLFVQGLTGSVLLFRVSLARLIDPAGMTAQGVAPPAPVSTLLASAGARFPGARVTRLFLPQTPRDTVFANLSMPDGSARYASLEPGSGKVLAAGSVWRFPLEAALQIHYRLMGARTGMAVILANGLALALLAATGLGFWWPGKQRIGKSLAIGRSVPARLQLRQVHRSAGVVLSAILLFSATTGVLLVAPDLAEANGGPAATALPPRSTGAIDRAIAQAQARFPQARLRDIRFPLADRLDINFFAPERNPRTVHFVSVTIEDARVTTALSASDNPVLWMKLLPLHTGDSFALPGKIALLAVALALAFLATSGPVMWWQARKFRRKAQR